MVKDIRKKMRELLLELNQAVEENPELINVLPYERLLQLSELYDEKIKDLELQIKQYKV